MLTKIETFISRLEEYFSVLLLVVMSIVVLMQVVFRYVFATPLSWTEELARYCLVWLTFVTGAMCIRSNSHFVVDFLLNKLSIAPRLLLQIAILFGMSVFAGVMFYTGVSILPVIDMQISPALRISMGYIYLAIPVGSFLMIFHIICAVARKVQGFKDPSSTETISENTH